jgi:hypothetical protein
VKDCKCLGQIVTNKNKLRRDWEKNCEYKQSILYCIVLYCIVLYCALLPVLKRKSILGAIK